MPGRSIGAVYITVLANTKGFEREAKDSADRAGEQSSRAYSKQFDKAFADIEKSKEFDKLADDLAKQWHDIGKDSGDSWGEGFKNAHISKNVDGEIKRIADRFNISQKEVATGISERLSGAYHRVEREADKTLEHITASAKRESKKVDREIGGGIFRSLSRIQNALRRAGSGGFFAGLTSVIGAIIGLGALAAKALISVGETIINVGKMAVDAAANMGSLVSKISELGAKGVATAIASGLSAAIEAVASAGVTALISLAAIVAVLAVLIPLAGAAAAALSAVAGMLVIVGAALVPLLGSALAILPVVVALGAAFGVLFLAILPLIKPLGAYMKLMSAKPGKEHAAAAEAFNKSLQGLPPSVQAAVASLGPLVGQFKDIAKSVSGKFFDAIGTSLSDLSPLVDIVGEGMGKVATALGDAAENLITLFSTTEGRQELQDFFTNVAPLASQVLDIFGQAILAMLGFFNALAPSASILLGNIDDLIRDFQTWITSAEGQNTIKKFMDDAFEAAGHIWNTVKNLIASFAILFGDTGAKGDGEDFLTTIENLSETFRTWIEKVSGNGELQDWLTRAKDIGSKLAKFIGEAADLFDRLDTPANRRFLSFMLDSLNFIAEAIGLVVTAWSDWVTPFIGEASTVWGWVNNIHDAFAAIPEAIQKIINKIGELLSKVKIGGLGGALFKKATGALGLAAGGITAGPTLAGEAGPEAVIPLTGALSSIDPSVRAMAAMIRGGTTTTTAGAVTVGTGVSPTINVYPVAADPMAVAVAVFNRAVSAARV